MEVQSVGSMAVPAKAAPVEIDERKRMDAAQYSADFILELRNMARTAGFKTLQSILELAYYEASSLATPIVITKEERERLREMEKAALDCEAASQEAAARVQQRRA